MPNPIFWKPYASSNEHTKRARTDQKQNQSHTPAYPQMRTETFFLPYPPKVSRNGVGGGTSVQTGVEGQKARNRFTSDMDFQVRLWLIQEETRRIAAVREAERTRLIQEEMRRIEAKLMLKRELERLRLLEEMRLAQEEDERDRVRRHKVANDKIILNAWTIYEKNWADISSPSSSEPLTFSNIPWPTLNRPSGPSSITLAAVSAFLLSETHSVNQKPKERIKEALRRWHPDRFVRFLRRVPLGERQMVDEAVGVVARHLNELLCKHSD
ncbi:uncharacterized protein FOMMEDRAFT_123128 [Fomitiporia mediterranea MF3/22]|uniref:uncharacterized protein n=1 Tax=Fomitiporia mediterranea (strain MF3/22) TaxID=694068 RepID=UPI0004407595|nr:uncharacterized protein FOMMEDRAFT_123128 [Fomitiporia mediterranea MF3/22]EJD02998.1 hypothetical protein FOMMEDRAFT_123128 [Fomitiporia mediterranea MF3/22]